ncbi:hypothetical protein DYBT9623_03168 [Dyadobacter sp. CECT 9623]|uniref:Peptidase MA-like domain-containing protein n=1 Tax=Dyadobacter linearis TaxID=2823330 RepID=A0ABM8USB3_9BACT|nr:hypothetical protein [Dyadobacter sp. CECT 9623]CAG5070622.1 hypothetical protein DYBT9623_03168 [Dyadobacter sp. CECT 9623]
MKDNRLPARALRIVKVIIALLFVLPASLFFLYPQIFYCELIGLSGFHENGLVYFSPEISPASYKKLGAAIKKSEARVDSFFSGKKSSPRIIICSNLQQYQRYCSSTEGAGCSVGTPWGNSYVILNAQGANVDVIAHEMSHIELLKRVGWWKVTSDIPQWFNEGVALMLDKRFVNNPDPALKYLDYMDEWMYYTGGGQEILELGEITTIKEFFNGGQKKVMLAYMSAGMEIAYWQTLSGPDGMQKFIENLSAGKSFEEAYLSAEDEKLRRYFRRLPPNPLRLTVSKKKSD